MRVLKLLLLFALMTFGIIALGKFLPHFLPNHTSKKPLILSDSVAIADSLHALQDSSHGKWPSKLFQPLMRSYALGPKSLRRHSGYWELGLPKGKPIQEYALDVEKLCRSKTITVIEGRELLPRERQVEYILASEGDTLRFRMTLNQSVLAGSAKLAIVWTELDSLNAPQKQVLLSTTGDKTFLLDPFAEDVKIWDSLPKQIETLVELPMEPSTYAQARSIPLGLFIHQNQKEVNKVLTHLLEKFPKAKGFGSKWGDRAVENQPLLDKFFVFLAPRQLVFLDLTGSQRSLVGTLAGTNGSHCKVTPVFRDPSNLATELDAKTLSAQKRGDAILVLAYSPSMLRSFNQWMQENQDDLVSKGLEFVKVSALF